MSDEWMNDVEISQGGGPPVGNYRSKFLGMKKTEHAEYGDGLNFCFEVLDGPHAGAIAARTASGKPTPGNGAGKLISQITGQPVLAGQKLNVAAFVGKTYLIIVELAKNGTSTRVSSVISA